MEVILKEVRLAFPSLFEPSAIGDGKPKYGAKLIVEPGVTTAVLKAPAKDDKGRPILGEIRAVPGLAQEVCEQAIRAVAIDKWQDKARQIVSAFERLGKKPDAFYVPGPYRNRDGEPYAGFEGMHFVSATNNTRPSVFDRDGRTQLIPADGRVYAGCYVNAIVSVWAQDNQYGRAIRASLKGVQFVRDGDAFGDGGVAVAGAFESLEDATATGAGSDLPW